MSADVWRAADTEARDLKSNAMIAGDVRSIYWSLKELQA
jgi:hypothetical protein